MHIKMKDGSIYKGFDAFRKIAWRLPAIKIFTPLLYIPGIPLIGRMVYKKIADSRYKCADGDCSHKT
jgi:predicted DCC family thiol-disulfide oxidoreductase YuxK